MPLSSLLAAPGVPWFVDDVLPVTLSPLCMYLSVSEFPLVIKTQSCCIRTHPMIPS